MRARPPPFLSFRLYRPPPSHRARPATLSLRSFLPSGARSSSYSRPPDHTHWRSPALRPFFSPTPLFGLFSALRFTWPVLEFGFARAPFPPISPLYRPPSFLPARALVHPSSFSVLLAPHPVHFVSPPPRARVILSTPSSPSPSSLPTQTQISVDGDLRCRGEADGVLTAGIGLGLGELGSGLASVVKPKAKGAKGGGMPSLKGAVGRAARSPIKGFGGAGMARDGGAGAASGAKKGVRSAGKRRRRGEAITSGGEVDEDADGEEGALQRPGGTPTPVTRVAAQLRVVVRERARYVRIAFAVAVCVRIASVCIYGADTACSADTNTHINRARARAGCGRGSNRTRRRTSRVCGFIIRRLGSEGVRVRVGVRGGQSSSKSRRRRRRARRTPP
ncbi:hypothetical protein C8J57DRAFT_1719323 [Mycena rebaudengoi]|nr:hypothetical protein C8J57DRAFT_1719323 [Mycena rebaudengoi]